jgi:hypothetical protein
MSMQDHVDVVTSLFMFDVENRFRPDQDLTEVEANASLEHKGLHKLSIDQLKDISDYDDERAEALFQLGDRIAWGIDITSHGELGWSIVFEAARDGHPVALAACFLEGEGVNRNEAKSFELLQGSTQRGHAAG